MGDESKIRDAAEVVKGIVEAVPVYQDVVQPAAKEVGTALQTVAKTIHVALAPVSALVWGYDQIRDYLSETLTKKLAHVPHERIVSPDLTVAGPAVEALRFAAHDGSLRELYANLLATSMDSQTTLNAHPAFVEFIRQMTPDEGRIIRVLSSKYFFPLFEVRAIRNTGSTVIVQARYAFLNEVSDAMHAHLMPNYIDNLQRMGLVKTSVKKPENVSLVSINNKRWITPEYIEYYSGMNSFKTCEVLLQQESIQNIFGRSSLETKRDHNEIAGFEVEGEKLSLSYLGEQFHSACIT